MLPNSVSGHDAARHLLLEKSKEKVTSKEAYKESPSLFSSDMLQRVSHAELVKIKILSFKKRSIAKGIWNRFTRYPLTDEQLDNITRFVEEKLSFDQYKFVEKGLIEWETSLVFSFRDLLEAIGINLFDIGRRKKDDI